MDNSSLSHSKWNCKYHIVFAPKYRRQIIYGKIKEDIGRILRKLCEIKGVEIVEANACADHIHMLVSIPPKISVASFVGYLKGKSSLMIFDRHANLKYKYGNRQFWCKGYYVDTVGRNKKVIEEYIKNQIQEDIAYEFERIYRPVYGRDGKAKAKIKHLLGAACKGMRLANRFRVRLAQQVTGPSRARANHPFYGWL